MAQSSPTPVPPSEADRIRRLVQQLDGGAALSAEARNDALETFERYECWGPYLRLVKKGIDHAASRQLGDYVRLARAQNLYLEDTFAAAETCSLLVQHLKIGFARFCEEVLLRVIEPEDYGAEAAIMGAICDKLPTKDDLVACLERLALLYEKKTHNDGQLSKTYERLLAVDKLNVKALRYFKLAYTQNNEWEEVVEVLKTLLKAVRRPQELFRVAQEFAAIYLYQLDRAEDAINVLETYCADSPLDTSTILFDAHQRLANWQGCLKVLRQCLLSVDDDYSRAVLHLKIASLHEQLAELDAAQDNFVKSATLWPNLLDSVEGVINVALAKRDWKTIQHWLDVLAGKVSDERLGAQLKQVQKRLKDGLDHSHAKHV